jgi:hypothetical protein
MKNHDPKRYVLVFKGHQLRGYADGTFIEVERLTDTFSESVGAQGDVVRIKSHDRRGTVTAQLQSASPSNDVLSAWAIAGEEGNTVDADVGALLVKDLNGTTVASAMEAWIVKPPNIGVATDHSPRQWVFRCANLKMLVGGSLR